MAQQNEQFVITSH